MTCADCKFSTDAAKDKMPGWLRCALAKPWQYRAPVSQCSFSPIRWVAKAAK